MADELKYTQEDMNTAMANKDKEVTAKFKSEIEQLKKDHENEISETRKEYLSKGEERAQMSADEKAKADYEDKMADIKKREERVEADKKSIAEQNALHTAKSKLEEKGIPSNFASLLSDVDENKMNENIESFAKDYQASIDQKVQDKVKGSTDVQTGDTQKNNVEDMNQEKWDKLDYSAKAEIYKNDPETAKQFM